MTESTPPPRESEPTASATGGIVPMVTKPRDDTNALPLQPGVSAQSRRMAFGILMLSTVCLGLGQTILFAVLPPIARKIGLADVQVGFIFTISAIAWVLMSPFWGSTSDRIGRKPILLLGVGSFVVSYFLLAIIMEVGMRQILPVTLVFILLIAFRGIYGMCSSAGPAAAQAYVADRTSPEQRASSMAGIAAAGGLGATLGPGIGSATVQFGLTIPLFIVSVIGALSFLAILFALPERSKPAVNNREQKLKFTDRRIRAILLYGLVGGVLLVLPVQLVGFYLIDVLELDEVTASQFLGVAFMVNSMASLFAQLVIIQRFQLPPQISLLAAPLLILIGFCIIAFGVDFGTIVFGLMISGLGTGLLMPSYSATVSLSVRPDEQGAAAGVANSSVASAFIFAPPIAFMLYSISPRTPFIIAAGVALVLAIYARAAVIPRLPQPESEAAGD